ncbi:MAG: S8 family serine peptidase [Halanaerobium sp.]
MLLLLIFLMIFTFSFHLKEELLKDDLVKIFIIDSEVEREFLSSPALKMNPESSHGSQVAAVIRSQSRAEIEAYSSENIIGRIDKNYYLNALRQVKNYAAVHPQQKIIVNISLGFEEAEFQEEIIKQINELDNLILIAAAGNNNSENLSYPAKFEKVIAVAALEADKKMPGSNYGQNIDFSAPGVIEITQRDYLPALTYSRRYKITGTSFAAPQMTALLANTLSVNPKINFEQALKIITDTTSEVKDPLFRAEKLGAGRIEQFKALSRANSLYFWLQILIYLAISFAALSFFYLCWQQYSLSGIFIFLIISALLFLMQPFLLLLYYQFGITKITVFLGSLLISYYLLLKLSLFYLKRSSNFLLILKIAPYLTHKLKQPAAQQILKILNQSQNKQQEKYQKKIITALNNCSSRKKCLFYLKLAAQLEKAPVSMIIKQSFKYNISAKLIGSSFKESQPTKNKRLIIGAELLALMINESYQIQKRAAAVALELSDPLILVSLKKLLFKRNKLKLNSQTQYFLLDLLAGFGTEAADFSSLLREIITQESDPWLKYHALQAYLKIAVNEESYLDFIKKVRAKEKEPVLLALDD